MLWRKLLCTFHPAAQNSPPWHSVAAGLCLFLPVVLFKFSPCAALVIKSFKHKAGSMGSVYSFPKSIILHINHWSGTFGQCWICYLFIFFPFSGYFTCESDSSPVSSCTSSWWPFHLINYICPLKKITLWHLDSRETIMNLNVEDETLIFQLVLFLHGNTG